MANNCLITKLKAVVNNDNLPTLGYVDISATFLDNMESPISIMAVRNTDKISDIELLNTDGASIEWNGWYCYFTKGSTNEIKLRIPSYDIDNIELYNVPINWNLSQFSQIFGLTDFSLNWNAYATPLSVFNSFKNLTTLDLSDTTLMEGDISVLSANTKFEELHFTNAYRVLGNLDSIKDMPNLRIVELINSRITASEETITYMKNRGITVTYTPYEE